MDLMRDMWEEAVNKARQGDTRAARMILRDFASAVDERTERTWTGPIPWQYARYIADAFRLSLSRVDANKALGLRSGDSGAPTISPDLKRLRSFRYCLRVLRLKATGKYATWEEAKTVTARNLGVSKSTIDKAWKSGQRIAAEIEFSRKRGKKSD